MSKIISKWKGKKIREYRVFTLVHPPLFLSLIIHTRLLKLTTWSYLNLQFLHILHRINWNISLRPHKDKSLTCSFHEQEASFSGKIGTCIPGALLSAWLSVEWINKSLKKIKVMEKKTSETGSKIFLTLLHHQVLWEKEKNKPDFYKVVEF